MNIETDNLQSNVRWHAERYVWCWVDAMARAKDVRDRNSATPSFKSKNNTWAAINRNQFEDHNEKLKGSIYKFSEVGQGFQENHRWGSNQRKYI